jgi:lipoprotein signal peptidase
VVTASVPCTRSCQARRTALTRIGIAGNGAKGDRRRLDPLPNLSSRRFEWAFFVADGDIRAFPLVIFVRKRFMLSPVINVADLVITLVSLVLLLAGQFARYRRQRRA